MVFNQIKHYLKLNKKILKYSQLKKELEKTITKIKHINYINYFKYAYQKQTKLALQFLQKQGLQQKNYLSQ